VRARLHSDVHDWKTAVDASNRFLAHEPGHADALIVRGRAHAKLGDAKAAAADFTRAIEARPLPDLYVERARTIAQLRPLGAESALRGLDQGITRLGPIVTLELEAIELELQLKRFDAALARLDRLSAQSAGKTAGWLAAEPSSSALAGSARPAQRMAPRSSRPTASRRTCGKPPLP
jgi:tetratricopeptide (TPR) repeat protein